MKSYLIDKFDNSDLMSNNKMYRLADCIYGWVRKESSSKKFHIDNYPKSIGSCYLKETDTVEYAKNKTPYVDHEVLYKIVMKEIETRTINLDELPIIHVRIGDAFSVKNASKISLDELCKSGNDYVQPYSFYEEISCKLKEINKKKVIIIAGCHNYLSNENFEKTKIYLRNIEDILSKNNIDIEYKLGGDPDEAFCLLSSAKIFIPGGGGFSRLAKHIVRKNGGKIWDSKLGYFGI